MYENHSSLFMKRLMLWTVPTQDIVWFYCDKKWNRQRVPMPISNFFLEKKEENFQQIVYVESKLENLLHLPDGIKSAPYDKSVTNQHTCNVL